MNPPALVVWDFDGVLNRDPTDGPFPWIGGLETALGIPPRAFRDFLSTPGQSRAVLRGEADLRDRLHGWLTTGGHGVDADDFLAHWLAEEDRPDAESIRWLESSPQRRVIGTNNPRQRADYIMETMGFAGRVETIFASGPMGVAKPDPGFFRAVEHWAGLAPADLLLVDDSRANVAAAAARGWQAFHFTPRSRATLPERLGIAA